MKLRTFNIRICCGVLTMVAGGCLLCASEVYADDYGGNNSGGVVANCSFAQAYQYVCGDGTGGASWHVYSTSNYSGPTYLNPDGILSGDIDVSDIKRDCPASQYDYYLAYGWDGRWNGEGSGYVHIGPAKWKQGTIAGASYNSVLGAIGYDDAKSRMENGTIADGQQLTSGAAESIHEDMSGSSTISDSTGYFCSPYHKEQYSGNSRIVEGTSSWSNTASNKRVETGWTQSAKKVVHFIDIANCDSVNGCTAKFTHLLRRDSGSSSTTYTIKRTSNYNTVSSKTLASNKTENFADGNTKTVYTDTVSKLFPGQVVCETLNFRPNTKYAEVILTSCVKVLGDAIPPNDPPDVDLPENPNKVSSDSAFINIKVRNTNVAKYNNYQREVYGKPSDVLAYRATYNPVLQYTYGLIPEKMQINKGTIYPTEGINLSGTLGGMYNLYKGSGLANWSNAFSIQKGRNDGSYNLISNHTYDAGSTTKQSPTPNSVTVAGSDVGSSIDERAITNLNGVTKTTPSQVTFEAYEKDLDGEYILESALSSNYALDLYGGPANATDGSNVILHWKNGTPAQDWRFDKNSDGTYTIVNPSSGLVLDVNGQVFDQGNISVYTSNGTCAQKWRVRKNSDGTYTFFSSCSSSNYAMDVYNGAAESYTNIWSYPSNNSAAQKWRLISLKKSKGNVSTAQKKKVAYARIPYNFTNTTEINTETDTVIYAGETKAFNIKIDTNKKKNQVTDGEYATIVRSAKWKLEVCYDGVCQDTEPTSSANGMGNVTIGNLNTSYNPEGATTNKNITINIPDIAAGSQICLRSAVYPASSGAYTNWEDKEGDHVWAYSSQQKCYTVAKKPSLQVWGGNIYLNGKTNTIVSVKGHLVGYTNYGVETKYSNKYVFGSWAENGIISNGTIEGLSSGAATGFAQNNNGELWPSYHPADGAGNNANINGRAPGGSKYTNICDRSTETFANCNGSSLTTVETIGNSAATNNARDGMYSVIAKYDYGGEQNVSGLVKLNDESKMQDQNIYYYYSGNESLSVNGETVDGTSVIRKGTTQIVKSNKDVDIVGNLIYEDGYSGFSEMPKLVIYAKGDINISCGVGRIDAILIAENSVKTCSDSNDINAQANSNQLMVNGAIIAKKLEAKRTYGAATGANSMIPAEIIDFDPTLYLWGGEQSQVNSETSTNMDITYNKELAPRR